MVCHIILQIPFKLSKVIQQEGIGNVSKTLLLKKEKKGMAVLRVCSSLATVAVRWEREHNFIFLNIYFLFYISTGVQNKEGGGHDFILMPKRQ